MGAPSGPSTDGVAVGGIAVLAVVAAIAAAAIAGGAVDRSSEVGQLGHPLLYALYLAVLAAVGVVAALRLRSRADGAFPLAWAFLGGVAITAIYRLYRFGVVGGSDVLIVAFLWWRLHRVHVEGQPLTTASSPPE